jgi:glycosyltransferase involved in cell wall biosynthesis
MAEIVFADDGIPFDGRMAATAPLGGAESAVVGLAEALARRGHRVAVHNRCAAALEHAGVAWRPLDGGLPESADLYVANRGDRLLPLVPRARQRAFWIHNPADYLLKWRYLSKLWRWRPLIVFSGAHHAATYPGWAPGRRVVIPYGVPGGFRRPAPRAHAPPPRAVFTSNPLRSLDWLLEVWRRRIHALLPAAELHVFAGAAVYGGGGRKAAAMEAVLAEARETPGVVLRGAVGKAELARELSQARLYLYRGDIGETFCLSAAEAQAMGVPAVVEDIACMRERVADGVTGFVTRGESAFAEAALRLLSDDALWLAQHRAAVEMQGRFGWDEAAAAWEVNGLVLSDRFAERRPAPIMPLR